MTETNALERQKHGSTTHPGVKRLSHTVAHTEGVLEDSIAASGRGTPLRRRLSRSLARTATLSILALSTLTFPACQWWSTPAPEAASPTPSPATPTPPSWVDGIDGSRRTKPVAVASGEAHEAPDIAVDAQGQVWMTWVALPDGQERIAVQQVSDQTVTQKVRAGSRLDATLMAAATAPGSLASTPLMLGEGKGATGWPRIATFGSRVWVTWAEVLDGRFQIRIAGLKDGTFDGVGTLSDSPFPAVRPALVLDAEHVPWVAWEEITPGGIRLMLRRVGGSTKPLVVDEKGELNQRASLALLPDGTLAVAWDHYEANAYDLRIRLMKSGKLEPIQSLTSDGFLDQAPHLRVSPDGDLWVAWHSNRVLEGIEARAGRGLVLARWTPAGLVLPSAGLPPTMPALPERPDQPDNLEFPTLTFDMFGRPHLFARRGQGYAHLMLNGQQWAEPVDLSEPGWGGRGRELRVVPDAQGTFHLAARWLHRLGYSLFEPGGEQRTIIALEPTPRRFEDPTAGRGRSGYAADGLWPFARAALTKGVKWAQTAPWPRPQVASAPVKPLPVEPATPGTAVVSPATPEAAPAAPPAVLPATVPAEKPTEKGTEGQAQATAEAPVTGAAPNLPAPPVLVPPAPTEWKRWRAGGKGVRLYFGDLHTHSWVSDGAGDPDEIFVRSRDWLGHDFVALTDHDVSNGNRYAQHEWQYAQLLANYFNRPGEFATVIAYEWTSQPTSKGGFGHRNIYFPGDTAPLFGVDKEAPDTTTLFGLIKSAGAFAIPHHTSWTGTDWEHFDPELQPLFEVVSVHGNSERSDGKPIVPRVADGATYAVEGLQKGHQFGFVGGSDGHGVPWHYGVSRQEDVWTTGLTGIYAPRLERALLHQALQQRLVMATSGPPIGIWFDANGAGMGRDVEDNRRIGFRVRVQSQEPLQSIELLKDGMPMEGFELDDINGVAEGVWIYKPGSEANDASNHFYYVRVIREDGAMAWSSPIRIRTNPVAPSSVR